MPIEDKPTLSRFYTGAGETPTDGQRVHPIHLKSSGACLRGDNKGC